MTASKATMAEIQDFIARNSAWTVVNNRLHREYVFGNFVQAFGFMTEAALVSESMGHHPEWFNAYKKVIIDLTTHEADGITNRDFELAKIMEDIARNR